MEIHPALFHRIRHALADAYPREACGLLLGEHGPDGRIVVRDHWPVPNRWGNGTDAPRRYLIGPDDVQAAEEAGAASGTAVVGTYHSHPDAPARPSPFDLEHAWPWYRYLIVSVNRGRPGEARVWELARNREAFTEHPLEVREA